jgi:CHASE2 domain-containing sensor protein
MAEFRVKLFVSSPADVKSERDRVVVVADRLNGAFEGVVRFDVFRWEDDIYSSNKSFQEQIDNAGGKLSEIDIFICVLWARIGLRLNPQLWRRGEHEGFESGTVYEYETALTLNKQNDGRPEIYLFRKSADIVYRADHVTEDVDQHKRLEAVWQRWTQSPDGYNAAGYQSFPDTDQFEAQLEGCLTRWLERKGIVVKDAVWDWRLKGSPFRGLAAFEPSHSSVFWGRGAAIASIIAKLHTARFVLLIGASGTGKSSLLRAGLVPRIIKPGIIPGIDLWHIALITPGKDSFLDLAQALLGEHGIGKHIARACGSAENLAALMRNGGDGLASIRSALGNAAQQRATERNYAAPRPVRILLAIDQLERLFVEANADESAAFAEFVQSLVSNDCAYVIFALRSDSYGSFQSVQGFLSLREGGAIHDLLPPTMLELEDIVTRPVSACFPPIEFERDASGKSLAAMLVGDAKGGDALPLLQMTLERLFQAAKARDDRLLKFSDYEGIEQAVIKAASDALSSLDGPARACLPSLITALVQDLSLETATSKRVITLQPVQRRSFERGHPERTALVDMFVAHRLLTVEEAGGETQIRAVHEALLRVWPEAINVLVENETIIRTRRTIEPLVEQWLETGKASGSDFLLTSPALLANSRELAERIGGDLSPDMREFIAASLAAEKDRADREAQQRSAILSATGRARAYSIPYYRPVAIALIVLAVALRIYNPPIIQWLGYLAFDRYQQISPRVKTIRPVTIVAIDEKSLAEIGQWPWPRTVMADLVTRLTELGAVVIGLDMVFPEPDTWSPTRLATTLQGLDAATRAKLSELPGSDEIFANAIKQSRVVVAEVGESAASANLSVPNFAGVAVIGSDPNPFLDRYTGRLGNLPVIEQAASGHGIISINPDRDSVMRRMPAIVKAAGAINASFPIEMLRVVTMSQFVVVHSSDAGIERIGLNGLRIPTDGKAQIWMHFGGPDPSIFISAVDVMKRRVGPDKIKGKMVIVGGVAFGLGDIRQTPVGRMPGSEIAAEAIENILAGSVLHRPAYVVAYELFSIILIGGLFALLMPVLPAAWLAVISLMTVATLFAASWSAFRYWQLLIDPVYPTVSIAMLVMVLTFVIYRYSESQRGIIRRFYDLQKRK